MADEQSARFAFPLLSAGQAQKEIYHNEALINLDILLHCGVESADISVPPADPAAGQCWIVAASASGAWAGHEGQVAGWTSGGWRFALPRPGMTAHVGDRGLWMAFDGADWNDGALRPDGLYLNGVKVVGEPVPSIAVPTGGTTIDAQARAVIESMLTLLAAHGLMLPSE